VNLPRHTDHNKGFVESGDILDARQFQIVVKRLADSLAYGTDHSSFLGAGVEYVQSRPYQNGDPVRSIDWRVTARTGRVYVKEYESPKCMPVYLLVDTSASMAVSSIRPSKYETALFVAGGIAFACLDRVSPVGLLGVGTRGLRIQPSLSKAQIMQWLLLLRSHRFDEGTRLATKLNDLSSSLTSRALVIVLSDLHEEGALEALRLMAQRHDCAVLQFADPAEESLAGAGIMRAREAETGREFWTHGRRQHLDRDAQVRDLRRGGVDHLVIHTDRPYIHTLRHFFASRGLLTKGAR
jgi:uncharacterized protein (DUF58 family)